jgi:hypothetical protein
MKLDFTTDQNPQSMLAAVLREQPFPDYASEGSWPTAEELRKLASTAFADQQNRLHPVHTKAATFLSSVYCAYAATSPAPAVVEGLKKAAQLHGIAADVDQVLQVLDLNKQAAENNDRPDTYALRDGQEHAFYPIGTQYDVTHSAEHLNQDHDLGNLPLKQARQACLKLVKQACNLGMDLAYLPSFVTQMGADTFVDEAALLRQAEWRERITGDAQYKQAAEYYLAHPTEDVRQAGADLWECADAVYEVKTSSVTPKVQDVWFSGRSVADMEKAANSVVFFGDEPVNVAVFAGVTEADVNGWYAGENRERMQAIVKAAKTKGGLEATTLLDACTKDERALLASHLTRKLAS